MTNFHISRRGLIGGAGAGAAIAPLLGGAAVAQD